MSNVDIRSSFAAAVGGRDRLADGFNARTFRCTKARADRELDDAADTVAGAYRVIDQVAKRLRFDDDEAIAAIKAEWLGRFRGAWAAFQHAGSRTLNWMITGPARFPVERNRKRMDTEHRRLEEMIAIANGVGAWAEKRMKRQIRAELGPVGVADSELDQARRKLAARECRQSMMKGVNAAIRKHRTKPDAIARISAELEAQGCLVEAALIPELLKPDFAGRIGFADYQLSNNNAEIRRLRGRVAELEQRAAAVHAAPRRRPSSSPTSTRCGSSRTRSSSGCRYSFPTSPDARSATSSRAAASVGRRAPAHGSGS
jgi:hypothetical protein